MLYCERCMHPTSENKCEECGHKILREVKHTDPFLLTTKDAIWTGVIEELLKENGIPSMTKGLLGGGLTGLMGVGLEKYSIYVPFSALEKAQELLACINDADEDSEFEKYDEMDALEEYEAE